MNLPLRRRRTWLEKTAAFARDEPAAAGLAALGAVAVVGVANAIRPSRRFALIAWSWGSAWAVRELAPVFMGGGSAAAAGLVALGATRERAGRFGLAGVLAADAVGAHFVWRSLRTTIDLDEEGRAQLDPDEPAVRYPRTHVVAPWKAWRRPDVVRRDDVVYHPDGLKLDVYSPRDRDRFPGARPAIVHVHGGAWVVGSRKEQGVPLLGHMAANGWVGINADYRLSPRATWPDHVVDVKRAIAWVREHADELGVDPSRVALTGGSAGGHLTALAALTADDATWQPGFEDADCSVVAAVPFYGVYDLVDDDRAAVQSLHVVTERVVFKRRRRDARELFRDASPTFRVNAGAPPMLVVHGSADSLVPVRTARTFVERLRAASGQPVLYVELPGGQHAFDIIPTWRTIEVVEAIERFLAAVAGETAEPPAAAVT